MTATEFTRFHFDYEYDERRAYEAQSRGYLGGVTVELSDSTCHPVFFYDPVRLAQDLEEESTLGRPFVAEKGMIVVKEINIDNMIAAVTFLAKHGFFQDNHAG